MLNIFLCLIIGYFFGCISFAYIIGRLNHIDIREHGSGNAGTTNTMRTLGKKAGFATYFGDVFKVVVAILLMSLLLKDSGMDSTLIKLITGFGVVLGHNYPFWLKFKGGKGIAVTSGVLIMFGFLVDFKIILVCGLSFFLTLKLTKYVSVSSMVMVSLFSAYVILISLNSADFILILIFAILFAASAVFTHRSNIKRLIEGTENKVGSKKNK